MKPGWIAKVAAVDPATVEPEPDQDVAPETFDQRHASRGSATEAIGTLSGPPGSRSRI